MQLFIQNEIQKQKSK